MADEEEAPAEAPAEEEEVEMSVLDALKEVRKSPAPWFSVPCPERRRGGP